MSSASIFKLSTLQVSLRIGFVGVCLSLSDNGSLGAAFLPNAWLTGMIKDGNAPS